MPWRLPWPRRQRTDACWAWGMGYPTLAGQKRPTPGIELTASSVPSCLALGARDCDCWKVSRHALHATGDAVGIKILFAEGSSLTAREFLSVLGPRDHWIEVVDSNPVCICRFSRWTKRVHRCP